MLINRQCSEGGVQFSAFPRRLEAHAQVQVSSAVVSRRRRVARGARARARLIMSAKRKFTRQQVAERCGRADATIIIDNLVYEVSGFLEDHPGGAEVLLDNAGKDASKCFRDVGHSDAALDWRRQFLVGELVDRDKWEVPEQDSDSSSTQLDDSFSFWSVVNAWAPPLTMAVLAALLYLYLFP